MVMRYPGKGAAAPTPGIRADKKICGIWCKASGGPEVLFPTLPCCQYGKLGFTHYYGGVVLWLVVVLW